MDASLRRLVCEAIETFCNLSHGAAEPLSIHKAYDADRQIYRLVAGSGAGTFALKVRGAEVIKQSDLSDDAAEAEFRQLEKAHATAAKSGIAASMPVPVALFRDYRAILTTWCEGRQLRRIYYANAWRWPLAAAELRSHFRHCGTWLGLFHNASRASCNAEELSGPRMGHVSRMLDQIPASPRNRLSLRELDAIRSAIRGGLDASARVERGLLHGNFTLRNILVSTHGIAPVDFEDSREDAVALDTGQFVADVILSGYRPFMWSAARRLVATEFLAAYREYVPLAPDHVGACVLYHMLAAYYEVVLRNAGSQSATLMANHQARAFAHMLRQPAQTVGACF
jgi:Ser/Thr protein kinase RdoA (MazF antagonist)